MKFITIINFLSKLLFTIGIFAFVKGPEDYLYVPLLNSSGFIFAAISGILIATLKFKVKFRFQNLSKLSFYLKDGFYIFSSNIFISLYTISNTFILGLITNNTIVGYYTSAEKIINAVKSMYAPFSQAFFPHFSEISNISKEKAVLLIKQVTKYVSIVMLLVSVSIFLFSEIIIDNFLGAQYHKSIVILKILSILPFSVSLSNIFGINIMLNFNYKKAFFVILSIASIFNLALSILLAYHYEGTGVAISVALTETLITFAMFQFLKNKGIKVI